MTLRQQNYVDQQNFNSEISVMVVSPWVTYLIADGLGLSGIVAILTNGVFLNLYAAPNISRASRKVLKIAYETIAYSAETLVFLFLGIGVFAFEHPTDKVSFGMLMVSLLNFILARAINVGFVSFLVNYTRDEHFITPKQQLVLLVSGLRGAMAYALAIQSIIDYGEKGQIMLFTTMLFTLITILGVGSGLHPFLTWAGVMRTLEPSADGEGRAGSSVSQASLPERDRCCLKCKRYLYNFNEVYFKPLFVRREVLPSDQQSIRANNELPVRSASAHRLEENPYVGNDTIREIEDDREWAISDGNRRKSPGGLNQVQGSEEQKPGL